LFLSKNYAVLKPYLPEKLISSLQGIRGFHEKDFVEVHQSQLQITSIRINPKKLVNGWQPATGITPVPWSSAGYYLSERPSFTLDPLFHSGCYYVQEASGMFLEQAIKQTTDLSKPLRVLDLCAAPGGKSTLIQSLLSADSLLVSNEVIKSRVNVLAENLIKWGAANVVITSNDPMEFSSMENYFDLIIIDAPCSGSGLFRRDPALVAEWSEEQVERCSLRQQRIIANVWPALKQNGKMIYSTCSYSKQENEDILDWMGDKFAVGSLQLSVESDWGIINTKSSKNGFYGYRFYPDQLKGEGFFIAALIKNEGGHFSYPKIKKQNIEILNHAEKGRVDSWLIKNKDSFCFFKHLEQVHAFPESCIQDMSFLQKFLYLKKAGILLGKIQQKELTPNHELAVSLIINPELIALHLSKEEAIRYLRREDLDIIPEQKGWLLVQFENHNLGWIKNLQNRMNNYYPMEWRILKKSIHTELKIRKDLGPPEIN
jgi:16S rRNA C967 or C1407 C5-methylase (RsmB/RsmF family)/NOL1/NOP2/fmu family ribosome biogenesis protein